MSTLEKLKQ